MSDLVACMSRFGLFRVAAASNETLQRTVDSHKEQVK